VRFSRGAGRRFEGHLSFAFDLIELDEERHANHARGDTLAVLDDHFGLGPPLQPSPFRWRFGVGFNVRSIFPTIGGDLWSVGLPTNTSEKAFFLFIVNPFSG
jgi:hypothetical protein